MTGWLMLGTYTLVNILPMVVLALLPFRGRLRLRPGWIVLLIALLCGANAAASWCSMHGASAARLSVLSIFCYLGFYLAAVRDGPLKLLAVLVDNAAPVPPKERDGVFLSSRHKGAGIGTQSVWDIAARYGGIAQFKWEDGAFYVSVVLNP